MNWEYIHGLFEADGSLYNEKNIPLHNHQRLKITLKQEKVIRNICEFLKKEKLTPKIFSEERTLKNGEKRRYWTVRLNKKKEIECFLIKKPKNISWDFIAGFSDGDGCFRYYNNTQIGMKPLKLFTIHVKKQRKIDLIKRIGEFLKAKNIRFREFQQVTYNFNITTDYELFKKELRGRQYVKQPV